MNGERVDVGAKSNAGRAEADIHREAGAGCAQPRLEASQLENGREVPGRCEFLVSDLGEAVEVASGLDRRGEDMIDDGPQVVGVHDQGMLLGGKGGHATGMADG